uniref:Uncharacterized protein n=1 Tax=Rangifer tarandus platyrhynchus TaxID=3082113 RepID=A0ACB0FGX5_RANTA|nr:unnamed protein product [Rangifer tarandus platyrhynchus]
MRRGADLARETRSGGRTAHALGQGPSRPPASPPPGAVGGRGGLHTGAWRDGALASDLGTRRSQRTEGNGSETGGSETEEGRTPGVKPDARASSSERQKRPLFLGAGRLGWGRLPSEGKARGQANTCGQRKQRAERRRLGKRGPSAQRASQRGVEARGQRPSAGWGDALSDESSPSSHTPPGKKASGQAFLKLRRVTLQVVAQTSLRIPRLFPRGQGRSR